MQNLFRVFFFAFLVPIFFGGFLFAQSNKVSGRVVDAETSEPLPGAGIRIENTTIGTITNLNGYFELGNIRSNKTTLIISYISYESVRLVCDFSQQDVLEFTIELAPATTKLQEVEIRGQAKGQVKAMLEQKLAVNIKNVVSSEQIEHFPDMNAAEAIQRIPGITLQRDQGEGRFVQLRGTPPELTNFNINGEQIPSPEGDVRYVGLDVISADQIEYIEISKVLTPDMDADGIGGNVNIITKAAEGEEPDVRASLAAGYNNLRQTGNYQVQFSYGQRFNKFGFNMNSSYYVNNQGSDNMEFEYAKGPFWGSTDEGRDNYFVQYREMQLRHYDITRKRIGLSATLDYKFNENSMIYLRGMYNSFSDNEIRRRVIYELDDAVSEHYYLYGGIDRDVRDRLKIQEISSLNIGGEHKIWGATVDYEGAYATAREEQPERIEALFDSPGQAITMQFDVGEPNWPRIGLPNPRDSINAVNYDEYEFEELLFANGLITDHNITSKLNIEIPYQFGYQGGYIKFGGKVRLKEKERDVDANALGAYFTTSNIYPGTGPGISLPFFDDGFRETNLLDRNYAVDNIPSPQKLKDFYEFYPQFFIIDRTDSKVQSYSVDYLANEKIYAGYFMVRHDIDKLMLLGGLRYERTDIDYEGRKINTVKNRFSDMDTLYDKRSHEFLLPQFQAKYTINDNFNLRAGFTYTYSRPNFEDVLPYREIDRKKVTYGNPNLEYPQSMNMDLLGEKYLKGGGLLSGGLFFKQIDNFIFYYKRFAHEGDPADYSLVEITKAINGINAFVYGAEVQVQSKLLFLPGFLSDFGVYLNYTYTYSEAFINKRLPANYTDAVVIFGEDDLSAFSSETEKEQITLPGQAKHSTNLAVFYETPKFTARISANFHDDFLYQLGADEDLDEYYGKAWHFDFTANYAITNYLKVFTDFINLSNAPLKFYLGTPDRILQQEYYSWWGRIGLKLNF